MVKKVITGGQTGAEQAGWAAARRAGIETGGYMPRGFLTESGPAPRLGSLYGAIEFPFEDPLRVRGNLRRADALFWFGDPESPEAREAFAACRELGKPSLPIDPAFTPTRDAASWLEAFEVETLVVSGDRASASPGLASRVESFLGRVIETLRRRA
ncbi:Putative molybdenum carrier [Aquisphaera giovannonii]|uniref:Molybdenum carrier n=1 Tax=Aquisphaera giovannonii TaxID=406548 RepID=A0A5B9W370_9BACT|nr:putative molybdenum carrier protein [Aquisphaera giovannonii]QEH34684.1 Putative molybdenum carrier [Aquisphaera giovannonii]